MEVLRTVNSISPFKAVQTALLATGSQNHIKGEMSGLVVLRLSKRQWRWSRGTGGGPVVGHASPCRLLAHLETGTLLLCTPEETDWRMEQNEDDRQEQDLTWIPSIQQIFRRAVCRVLMQMWLMLPEQNFPYSFFTPSCFRSWDCSSESEDNSSKGC